jgi:hypothetical protein
MNKRVKLVVTKEDIKKGKRDCCRSCPIALSARRTFHLRKDDVDVAPDYILIDSYPFIPSRAAVQFMNNFDNKLKVKPATFVFTGRFINE